jgi:hypothetical protein
MWLLVILIVVHGLGGCTIVSEADTPMDRYLEIIAGIDELTPPELRDYYTRTVREYEESQYPETALRLGYLLSRPDLPLRNLANSRVMLNSLPPDFEPLRSLLLKQLDLIARLDHAEDRILQLEGQNDALRSQLDALRAIEEDLTQGQADIEELSQ